MKKILNVILGLAFIVIIVSGWVFSAIAYNKINKFEKQYQADMEELEIDLNDKFYSIETAISDLKDRITDLEDADIEELQRYSKQILNELTIYEYVLEAQHDLATGKITLEEYNERMNYLANQWEEIIYDYIPSLVERIEELEDIANAFDDLEDALEKALNATNARLDALEGSK